MSLHGMASVVFHTLFGLFMVIAVASVAFGHEWYPIECCSAMDCAPVDQYSFVSGAVFFDAQDRHMSSELPRMIVTTSRGTFVLPDNMPRRVSKDNRMHVCSDYKGKVLCIFEPPGM